jgi:hypothetical protein
MTACCQNSFGFQVSANRVAEAIRPHGFFVFTHKAEGRVREKEGWVGGLLIALFNIEAGS